MRTSGLLRNRRRCRNPRSVAVIVLISIFAWARVPVASNSASALELAGLTVTPHVTAAAMRYRLPSDPELGARVQLFVRNSSRDTVKLDANTVIRLRDKSPDDLLANDEWAWHDFPSAWPDDPLELPPETMTVWSFNGKRANWSAGTAAVVEVQAADKQLSKFPLEIQAPTAWISAATFLGDEHSISPDTLMLHVVNRDNEPLTVTNCRLWLPKDCCSWRTFAKWREFTNLEKWPTDGTVLPSDQAMIRIPTGPLPLTYAVVELVAKKKSGGTQTLWAHMRTKRESFDISGGWVHGEGSAARNMTFEPFLKTLRRMHINTAHFGDSIPGYTDQTGHEGLYTRYPLKFFNKLQPTAKYETREMLPRVHAVEFLGEPQYGGGRPVSPMEVWRKLAPYQRTQLPTTITHSEERVWRYYAGLSDFPHYDAYRICAPSPDAWGKYDRWGSEAIRWGAPLETIGDMCRSLRELNRPLPTAYWSQGPHVGWASYGGRKRTSPTPDELRLQAYHALASRITSLYWFNLSLPSLVRYRDTLDELTRVNRETMLLSRFYLMGSAYQYGRVLRENKPDWDLASIVSPDATLCFALDLDYFPDAVEKVFRFHSPREVQLHFRLPPWLGTPADVFRIDADGVHNAQFAVNDFELELTDTLNKVGIYVVAPNAGLRAQLEKRRQELVAYEESFGFDAANNDADYATLAEFAHARSRP